MNAQHTTGPWFTKSNGFSAIYVEARLRPGVIQEVAACGPTEAGSEQQAANARLIAAAPDLLYALESIVEMNPELPMGMIEAAHAAIAKATGEQA